MTENAKARLAEWSQDELHVLRSVRHFEPTYQNPAAIRRDVRALLADLDRATEAIDLVDTPYPLEVFPERTDEQRDAIFAAMRQVDKYATEWFYAHVARDRGRVAREHVAAGSSGGEKP